MEFILISDDKLKIIMSKRDLEKFDISAEELDYSNVETKRMLWDILGKAKQSIGFSCDGERVLVRLYTSRDGSCELFVSKLGSATDEEVYMSDISLGCPYETIRDFGQNPPKKKKSAYRFNKLEWLIEVCRRLSDMGYSGNSDVFVDTEHSYYLFFDRLDDLGYFNFDEFSFINEYGEPENAERAYELLCEYGEPICTEKAVEILSAF